MEKKFKMAIVSSYNESCGNAAFTQVLINSIEKYHPNIEVNPVRLSLNLLQSGDRYLRKQSKIYISSLVKRLRKYDFLNLQIEYGLYGLYPKDIISRIKILATVNKNTTMTMHSVRLMGPPGVHMRKAIKNIFIKPSFKSVKVLLKFFFINKSIKLNRAIIKLARKHKIKLIVHTMRAKRSIVELFDYHNVVVHPLKFVDDKCTTRKEVLYKLRKYLNLSQDNILIGIFGYIGLHKGHLIALQALKKLPNNFKLLIFGRQHPQTITWDEKISTPLDILIQYLEKNPALQNRVFFLNELQPNDFYSFINHIDVVWLPYYENGQDGSGIASICLDLSSRVICSNAFVFDELFELSSYKNVFRFDIGNYYELANQTIIASKTPPIHHSFEKSNRFNLRTQTDIYVDYLELNL